jgi:anti-sigma factor (TIGR02949 family)
MKCSVVQRHISSYLDGAVTRSQLAQMNEHIADCEECSAEYEGVRRMQKLVSSLGRKPAPPEVALRVRVALSQELANARRPRWEALAVRWQNAFNAIMVPATAGLITTIIIFGLLISFLYPGQLTAANDVPTAFYTPPELQAAPFEMATGLSSADDLVVEAYIDANGRVQDYRILSGPDNMKSLPADLKNVLIFTTFRPAMSFGRPTSGRAIMSFSKIQVKG